MGNVLAMLGLVRRRGQDALQGVHQRTAPIVPGRRNGSDHLQHRAVPHVAAVVGVDRVQQHVRRRGDDQGQGVQGRSGRKRRVHGSLERVHGLQLCCELQLIIICIRKSIILI